MLIQVKTEDMVKKVRDGEFLSSEDIYYLLKIKPHSVDAGFVIGCADEINRDASRGKAEIHSQIGLNLSPCPNNCSFCAFAARNKVFSESNEFSVDQVVEMSKRAEKEGTNALFIMTTGDYPFEKFIDVSREIRNNVKPETKLIANIGDFEYGQARELVDCGYAGIYHAVRMGEGKVTNIRPEKRLNTVNAAREAGLMIGTCVEPIGPEHDAAEIVEKILIGRDMNPCYSGAMRRISIPGSELEKYGMLTEYQLAYIVAVVRLSMGRYLMGNCTHEPNLLGPVSGANLFWAETGSNPRDTEEETSKGRGMDAYACRKIFEETDFEVQKGPSIFYSELNRI